jgi:quinone-modifying oxidoreductase subunit QmoC
MMVLVPWLFWIVLLAATTGIVIDGPALADHAYEGLVPHWLIYAVYFPVAGWVTLAAAVSGVRFWKLLGEHGPPRKGSFLSGLTGVLADIALHRSYGKCDSSGTRRTGHLLLFWGFVGAAVTSGLLVVGIYGHHIGLMSEPMDFPISLLHPFKILGNLSAVLLVVGGVILMVDRYGKGRDRVGSTSFDNFFIGVVATVIVTGVIIEIVRVINLPAVAWVLYTFHLGIVLTLFITFPYSKFAHMLYRALALIHQRQTEEEATG